MRLIPKLILFLLASACIPMATAQLDTRSLSGLEARTLGNPVPLAQDEAFPFYVNETGAGQLRIIWNLAPGHYLYRHAFHFTLQSGASTPDVELSPVLPAGLQKTDEFFGAIEAYYGQVSADLSLPANTRPNAILLIQYQGCADWGFCYPPQRREYPLQP